MSALDGAIEAGDLVWQQMYSPTDPEWASTLEERIEHGRFYGDRTQMRVVRIYRDGIDGPCRQVGKDGMHPLSGKPLPAHTEHYITCVPGSENDRDHYSSTDNNWCVLELATEDGALF
ncbi:hypothetical protein SCB71_14585 [Herbiconiux sp. KACC 21604]|uniref:hypothetical protein n=1 Tax=unclassified Herbiconiux TaxID=2618217 RepID=UPI00149324C7|nr:hypothetical protein [Herbiconiux sp. SALV-R1]QJU54369.1 hypothetical protein HL652_12525 [Herbiconiux sp. SALV-R1]WPO85440.1 hypothetical protein SCB71_14585 [Herbiconiux sp. KACC 21604]